MNLSKLFLRAIVPSRSLLWAICAQQDYETNMGLIHIETMSARNSLSGEINFTPNLMSQWEGLARIANSIVYGDALDTPYMAIVLVYIPVA